MSGVVKHSRAHFAFAFVRLTLSEMLMGRWGERFLPVQEGWQVPKRYGSQTNVLPGPLVLVFEAFCSMSFAYQIVTWLMGLRQENNLLVDAHAGDQRQYFIAK